MAKLWVIESVHELKMMRSAPSDGVVTLARRLRYPRLLATLKN